MIAADRPSLQMFADMPLRDDKDDRLDFKSYANAIAGVIDKPETSTPFTLGINAPWGAGKTTLGMMIDRRLGEKASAGGRRPHVTCWFDAWQYDDAPNLTSALAAHVARAAEKNRPMWRRIVNPMPNQLLTRSEVYTRMVLLLLIPFLLSLIICELWFPTLTRRLMDAKSLNEIVRLGIQPVSTLGLVYALLLLVTRLIAKTREVGKSIGEIIKNPAVAANRGEVDEARAQLKTLMIQATPRGSRFVIFIDNLDRCRPSRTVEVLEVGSQLLNHEGIVTVILADMARVAAAVEVKYADIGKALGGRPSASLFARTFLQKILHLQFDVPSFRLKDIQGLIKGYAPQRIEDFSRHDSLVRKLGKAIKDRWNPVLRRNLTAWTTRIWRNRIDQLVIEKSKTQETIDWFRLEYFVGFDLVTYSTGLNRMMLGELTFALIKERVQRYIEMQSEQQREDRRTVMAFLPLLPRHAKRLLNRFRLLLFIAHERNMLGPNSDLRTEHLGKWAVLLERWPEFAEIVSRNSQIVTDLERCAQHDEKWHTTINEVAPWLAEELDFRSFCGMKPELGPWMNALIAFQLSRAEESDLSDAANG